MVLILSESSSSAVNVSAVPSENPTTISEAFRRLASVILSGCAMGHHSRRALGFLVRDLETANNVASSEGIA